MTFELKKIEIRCRLFQNFYFGFDIRNHMSNKKKIIQKFNICKFLQNTKTPKNCLQNESVKWLNFQNAIPMWSRLRRRNIQGQYRNIPPTKHNQYDIEIAGYLWSLWGSLHPNAAVFNKNSRGRQYLACCVVACCAASIYNLSDWNCRLLDNIIISGDCYHSQSLTSIKKQDYEFCLENLNSICFLNKIAFEVHLEFRVYGKLYASSNRVDMNLAEALMYFFNHWHFGIISIKKRCLAFGVIKRNDNTHYFMYDCQSQEFPLFPKQQAASYLLKTNKLQILLYCMIVTLNIQYYNVRFDIHSVEVKLKTI